MSDSVETRLAVCQACEHNVRGRCRKAGRHVQVLVRAEEPACPEHKWPEQQPAEGQRDRGTEGQAGSRVEPPAAESGERTTRTAICGRKTTEPRPAVDVILPYSGAYLRWVPLCLETLRMQVGVRPIVHLIADGLAESEDPLRWRYAGCRDVHVYSSMDNVGPYVQANRVAGRLTAEWLAIADADDWYFPDRFERQIARLQAEGADIIGSSAWNLLDPDDPEDNELVARRYASHRGRVAPSGRYNSRRLCPGGNVLNPTMTLRRSCFLETGGFANWAYGADWDFVGRAEHAGYAVVRENYDVEGRAAIVGVHRMHARSLTANEATGINTPARRERNQEIEARTTVYKAGGYDPRDYGGLRDCRPERTVRVF